MLVIFQLTDNLFCKFYSPKRQNFSNENCTPVRIYMRTGFDITDLEVWRSIQLKIPRKRSYFLSKWYVKSSIESLLTILFRLDVY